MFSNVAELYDYTILCYITTYDVWSVSAMKQEYVEYNPTDKGFNKIVKYNTNIIIL